jgi:hypothetical protein
MAHDVSPGRSFDALRVVQPVCIVMVSCRGAAWCTPHMQRVLLVISRFSFLAVSMWASSLIGVAAVPAGQKHTILSLLQVLCLGSARAQLYMSHLEQGLMICRFAPYAWRLLETA